PRPARGESGFSVRTLAGGKPVVEHFGNIKETSEGLRMEEEREPMVDVFDEKDHVLVVAEMPGVEKEDVDIKVKEGHLELKVQRGKKKYYKYLLLPSAVDESTLSSSCKNGILEIKIAKKG
ncbi:MAG: Hsp20/alpha crystallin family protein, partial [Deltaproteobacteria bacterium]|nr:Hsp20/alpha crystallin family protein [Deltaproteobacteria bacterium]